MSGDVLDEDAGRLRVSVAFSPRAGEVDESELTLANGATVADALRDSGLQARHPSFELESLTTGIWGVTCGLDKPLRDRDRVEVYRLLLVDPKAARRRRQQVQQQAVAAQRKLR